MEQAEFTEHQIVVQEHSHHTLEHSTAERPEDRDYPATNLTWLAFMVGAVALLIVGAVAGVAVLLLFNYTSGGFS